MPGTRYLWCDEGSQVRIHAAPEDRDGITRALNEVSLSLGAKINNVRGVIHIGPTKHTDTVFDLAPSVANALAAQGWELIAAVSGVPQQFRLYFRKTFD